LDLSDRSSWYCVPDEGGEVISEQKLRATPKAVKKVFATMRRSRQGTPCSNENCIGFVG